MSDSTKSESRYWAFISYSSKDRNWGTWLHRRLENFPIPEEFRGSEVFDGAILGKSLRPVFRDRDELSGSADLGAAIQRALERSHFLVVLCSKHSAQSKWVNQEIENFRKLKGDANILALILDGTPNATTTEGVDDSEECFPPALRYPNEPLAGDMRKSGDGKERGFLKVVAGIAQLDFDRLYRRHERNQQRRRFWIGVAASAIICVMAGLSAIAIHQREVAQTERNEAVRQEQLAIEERNRADVARAEAVQLAAAEAAAKRAAEESETKARKALAAASLDLSQQMRWQGDYPSAIRYLTDSLRNDPGLESASDIAWAMLNSEGLRFAEKISDLPEDRLIGAFTRDGSRYVWVDADGRLMSLAPSGNLNEAESHGRIAQWDMRDKEMPVSAMFLPAIDQLSIRFYRGRDNGDFDQHEVRVGLQPARILSHEIVESAWDDTPGTAMTEAAKQIHAADIRRLNDKVDEIGMNPDEESDNPHLGRGRIIQHDHMQVLAELFAKATRYEDLIWRSHGGHARYEAETIITASGALLHLGGSSVAETLFLPAIGKLLITRFTYFGAPVLEWVDLSGEEHYTGMNPSEVMHDGVVGDNAGWWVAPDQSTALMAVNGRNHLVSLRKGGHGVHLRDEVVGIGRGDAIAGDPWKGDRCLVAGERGIHRIRRNLDNRILQLESPWDVFGDGPESTQSPVEGRFIHLSDHEDDDVSDPDPFQWTRALAGRNILESINGPIFHPLKSGEGRPVCVVIESEWAARSPSSHVCLFDSNRMRLLNRGHWGLFSRIDPDQWIVVSGGLIDPHVMVETETCFYWVLKPGDERPPPWLADFLESMAAGKLSADRERPDRLLRNWDEMAAAYGYEIPQ